MFKFLKNKSNKNEDLLAPSEGYLMDLKSSKDELFHQKTLGDGFYIKMSDDKVYSPINGVVVSVFPTNHWFFV